MLFVEKCIEIANAVQHNTTQHNKKKTIIDKNR